MRKEVIIVFWHKYFNSKRTKFNLNLKTMFSRIFGAFLMGAITGAVLGVLYSPDKGSETRRKISESTEDIVDELSRKIEEGKEVLTTLQEKLAYVSGKASEKTSNGHQRRETSTAKGGARH
jgi:gas vesicle protein